MGSINYKTNDFITLAIKPYDVDDYLNDAEFVEWAVSEYGADADDRDELEDLANEEIQFQYEVDAVNAEAVIDKYNLRYFDIKVKSGYYEGLQIVFDVDFDYYTELEDAVAEIEPLRALLKELNGCGYQATIPGWVSGWYDYTETDAMIDEAIEQIRAKVYELFAEDTEAV